MTNRKNNNSILFLTTLGVYLGLVLVGATPVLGHAALTRNFELQDEIEVSDDLDNKPKDSGDCDDLRRQAETLAAASDVPFDVLGDYTNIIVELARALNAPELDTYFFSARSDSAYPLFTRYSLAKWNLASETNNKVKEQTELLSGGFPDPGRTRKTVIEFAFDKTPTDLRVRTEFHETEDSNALRLFAFLDSSLAYRRCSSASSPLNRILEDTKAHRRNNVIIIITRLPRASIDPLLATNAK